MFRKNALLWFCLGLLTLGSIGITTGCNTTEGVGKDIEATGDAIKDTARDAKD